MEYTITFPVPLNKPMRRKYHFNYGPFTTIATGTIKCKSITLPKCTSKYQRRII
jgi:hypothetical protein